MLSFAVYLNAFLDAFYGTDDPTLHNVDVMTDISMPATTFTRYTAAPSTVSRTSKYVDTNVQGDSLVHTTYRRSSRSKRKLERKVGSGRKGTVDEEEYLLKSITKLVGRFNTTRGKFVSRRYFVSLLLTYDWSDEARDVLPHLFQFTSEHREEGRALQAELSEFEEELGKALEEVWTKATDEDVPPIDSWAARMEERERTKAVNPVDKVPKPELSRGENWRIRLYELGGAWSAVFAGWIWSGFFKTRALLRKVHYWLCASLLLRISKITELGIASHMSEQLQTNKSARVGALSTGATITGAFPVAFYDRTRVCSRWVGMKWTPPQGQRIYKRLLVIMMMMVTLAWNR
jgi:hypothetical protein